MENILQYPFNSELIMKKRQSLKRQLLAKEGLLEKKLAILGGSTTSGIKGILELFLLEAGIKPKFYESEYNKFYEDSMFGNEALELFQPDFIYIHTTTANLTDFPMAADTEGMVQEKIEYQYKIFFDVLEKLQSKYPNAVIVQNNFELPYCRYLGNMDGVDLHGSSSFIQALNIKMAEYIRHRPRVQLNDIFYLSASLGLTAWYDRTFWHAYKIALSYDAIPMIAHNITTIIKACLGKSKKCLVLDLDNTLWGGVIGEDGVNGIQIGKETALAEAYTEFQQYVLRLKERGIILAVCSKNDESVAKQGFTHPDSILKQQDFTSFQANWREKYINIIDIATEINIGLDSMVFVDDNPVERKIVRDNLPEVSVPEIDATDISSYIRIIEGYGYFETVGISKEDLSRNQNYISNQQRRETERSFVSYGEFLRSLQMTAEIQEFQAVYIERIAQLTNKTNQFNLTTKRYTKAEIERIAADPQYLTLYGRLKDKFGDNGLVSAIIGRKSGTILCIELWLMSCRVLKRDMELAMFDVLVDAVRKSKIRTIRGIYYQTAKNQMVERLYEKLGFELIERKADQTVWEYCLGEKRQCLNQYIGMQR